MAFGFVFAVAGLVFFWKFLFSILSKANTRNLHMGIFSVLNSSGVDETEIFLEMFHLNVGYY